MLQNETFMYQGQRIRHEITRPIYQWVMGVDPGQSIDHTAISLMHHTVEPLADAWDLKGNVLKQKALRRYDVVGLRRLPLGVLYPDQVSTIATLLDAVHAPCDLVMDDTSNFAVADLCQERGLNPVRITFTSGLEVTQIRSRKFGVPKSTLIGNVDAKLHVRELKFAKDLTEGEELKYEFANLQRIISAAGRAMFEARSGKHDDIVFSIAVALWWAIEKPKRCFMRCGGVQI